MEKPPGAHHSAALAARVVRAEAVLAADRVDREVADLEAPDRAAEAAVAQAVPEAAGREASAVAAADEEWAAVE
jgi:hypothetical protein